MFNPNLTRGGNMVVEEELNNKSKDLTFVLYISISARTIEPMQCMYSCTGWYGSLDLVTTQPCTLVYISILVILIKEMFWYDLAFHGSYYYLRIDHKFFM